MLVAAVLRPEEREDRQLEMVRFAAEQLDDTRELPVRQTESAVDGLFGDLRQVVSLVGKDDGGRRVVRERESPSPPDAGGAGGDLGLVVHVHHDRAAGPRTDDADPVPDGIGRARARRLRAARRAQPVAAPPVRLAARAAGADQHVRAVLPDRLGPAVHRLRPGGDLQRLRPALHRALRALDRPHPARHRRTARRRRARLRRRRSPRRLRARRRRARGRRRGRRRRRLGVLRDRRALRRTALRRPAAVARRLGVARLGDALRAPGRRRAGDDVRLGVAALRALPRRRRDRRRVPPLLRPDRRRGGVEGGARHLPGAVAGARLRRGLPRRDRDRRLARRPCARADRGRSGHGYA